MSGQTKGDATGRGDVSMSPAGVGPPVEKTVLSTLKRAVAAVRSLDGGFEDELERLEGLEDRLEQGRFHLAVLGQFKRGKSTLLNALLGEPVLPSSVIPLTAISTFIRFGEARRARVEFKDHREPEDLAGRTGAELADFLAAFVTETGNPGNRLGVRQVDVSHPAAILRRGVVLIDTPGVGSTFRHNTEAAVNFLPQCDAALFLVSADPPITEVEIDFLKQVRSKIPRLFFFLNKVDYLSPEELQCALDFLRQVLLEKAEVPAETPVFCVSAKKGLEARRRGDPSGWTTSGLADVERHLVEFLAGEKTAALAWAVARKTVDILAECQMRLGLTLQSLRLPSEVLKARADALEGKIEETQQERNRAVDLLAGDRRRMHELLEEHAEHLRLRARQHFGRIVREAIGNNGRPAESEVQEALAEAIPAYFEDLAAETNSLFETRVGDSLRSHQARAEGLIESIRRTASELFELPYHAPESDQLFEMVRDPFWVTHKWTTSLVPMAANVVDRLVSASTRADRLRRRLLNQVSALVISNVENLRWATFQSIDQTCTRFQSALDQRLADTVAATRGAIRSAVERRLHHGETIRGELARLEKSAAELESLQAQLEGV